MTDTIKMNPRKETLKSFRTKMEKVFSETEDKLELGYNGRYYWETYEITKKDNGVEITFNIGSRSGHIPCLNETSFFTWGEFYELIKNKMFENKEMTLTFLIKRTLEMKAREEKSY